MKLYTIEELKKKYAGKFIETYPHYDYQKRCKMYEVRGVSKTIRENYETPEELEQYHA